MSHMFGGPIYVNSQTHGPVEIYLFINYKRVTIIFKVYLIISMIFEDLFSSVFFTYPVIFLPIHSRFYPSK